MVKIHFLQKVLKKWSSFRKRYKKIFHNRGGGVRTLHGIFHNFLKFFLNPSLRHQKWPLTSENPKKNFWSKIVIVTHMFDFPRMSRLHAASSSLHDHVDSS